MKTPLQELIERLESLKNLRKIANPHFKEGVSQSIDIATELLEKEREIAQEYAKQSKQEEVEFSNFETCVRSFIRSKHLSYEWDKWIAEWYEKTPTPREG